MLFLPRPVPTPFLNYYSPLPLYTDHRPATDAADPYFWRQKTPPVFRGAYSWAYSQVAKWGLKGPQIEFNAVPPIPLYASCNSWLLHYVEYDSSYDSTEIYQ